jgi:hypothetical protein
LVRREPFHALSGLSGHRGRNGMENFNPIPCRAMSESRKRNAVHAATYRDRQRSFYG